MKIKNDYGSPRWTGEILDCSMPMTFDTYSHCSHNCLYCFSFYQKSHTLRGYQTPEVRSVNVELVKRIFLLKTNSQFNNYIKNRKVMQWGGLGDPFCWYEKQYGVTLELLKFFKEINYPLSFSTKATWFLEDKKYTDLIRNQKNWHFKFSIITLDEEIARKIEKGVPTPNERLEAIKKITDLNCAGATLRLRPFLFGTTENNYLELIKRAAEKGAISISTEFFCLERRADKKVLDRYKEMSKVLDFDIIKYYVQHTPYPSGYLRLCRKIKEPYVKKMKALCESLKIGFFVSDAHFKEYCEHGSCCGLPKTMNYCKGQFTNALVLCRKNGKVYFKDIEPELEQFKKFQWINACGYNTGTLGARGKYAEFTMFDFIKYNWNHPKLTNSPYKYFEGVMYPIGLDEDKNVIYEYRGD